MKNVLGATLLGVAMMQPAIAADDPLEVDVRMESKKTFVIEITPAEGWSISGAGLPRAILQLEVPDAIVLAGDVITDAKELSRNGFLMAPYERAIDVGRNEVKFFVPQSVDAEETLGVNVIAYMRKGEDGPARFVRIRREFPIHPGATPIVASPVNTAWGDHRAGLQIGDKATPFTWSKADGTKVSLADHVGKHDILITTYRAFW